MGGIHINDGCCSIYVSLLRGSGVCMLAHNMPYWETGWHGAVISCFDKLSVCHEKGL